MAKVTLDDLVLESHVRTLDMRRDLEIVADLIESSFELQHDVDGQAFLKEMRQAAKDARFLGWVGAWSQSQGESIPGFVWEQDGQVVGNVSIIPFIKGDKKTYVIANVAVKEAYRRQGIARALTDHAIRFLHRRAITDIWLQVKATNDGAIKLYENLGFQHFCCRNTWRAHPPFTPKEKSYPGKMLSLRWRKRSQWPLHKDWLEKLYPPDIQWHFLVSFADFNPSVAWQPSHWGEVLNYRHYCLFDGINPLGFLTRQATQTYANSLWLAINPDLNETDTVLKLLQMYLRRPHGRRPMQVDYPCCQAEAAFQEAGFSLHRTLIWMRHEPG